MIQYGFANCFAFCLIGAIIIWTGVYSLAVLPNKALVRPYHYAFWATGLAIVWVYLYMLPFDIAFSMVSLGGGSTVEDVYGESNGTDGLSGLPDNPASPGTLQNLASWLKPSPARAPGDWDVPYPETSSYRAIAAIWSFCYYGWMAFTWTVGFLMKAYMKSGHWNFWMRLLTGLRRSVIPLVCCAVPVVIGIIYLAAAQSFTWNDFLGLFTTIVNFYNLSLLILVVSFSASDIPRRLLMRTFPKTRTRRIHYEAYMTARALRGHAAKLRELYLRQLSLMEGISRDNVICAYTRRLIRAMPFAGGPGSSSGTDDTLLDDQSVAASQGDPDSEGSINGSRATHSRASSFSTAQPVNQGKAVCAGAPGAVYAPPAPGSAVPLVAPGGGGASGVSCATVSPNAPIASSASAAVAMVAGVTASAEPSTQGAQRRWWNRRPREPRPGRNGHQGFQETGNATHPQVSPASQGQVGAADAVILQGSPLPVRLSTPTGSLSFATASGTPPPAPSVCAAQGVSSAPPLSSTPMGYSAASQAPPTIPTPQPPPSASPAGTDALPPFLVLGGISVTRVEDNLGDSDDSSQKSSLSGTIAGSRLYSASQSGSGEFRIKNSGPQMAKGLQRPSQSFYDRVGTAPVNAMAVPRTRAHRGASSAGSAAPAAARPGTAPAAVVQEVPIPPASRAPAPVPVPAPSLSAIKSKSGSKGSSFTSAGPLVPVPSAGKPSILLDDGKRGQRRQRASRRSKAERRAPEPAQIVQQTCPARPDVRASTELAEREAVAVLGVTQKKRRRGKQWRGRRGAGGAGRSTDRFSSGDAIGIGDVRLLGDQNGDGDEELGQRRELDEPGKPRKLEKPGKRAPPGRTGAMGELGSQTEPLVFSDTLGVPRGSGPAGASGASGTSGGFRGSGTANEARDGMRPQSQAERPSLATLVAQHAHPSQDYANLSRGARVKMRIKSWFRQVFGGTSFYSFNASGMPGRISKQEARTCKQLEAVNASVNKVLTRFYREDRYMTNLCFEAREIKIQRDIMSGVPRLEVADDPLCSAWLSKILRLSFIGPLAYFYISYLKSAVYWVVAIVMAVLGVSLLISESLQPFPDQAAKWSPYYLFMSVSSTDTLVLFAIGVSIVYLVTCVFISTTRFRMYQYYHYVPHGTDYSSMFFFIGRMVGMVFPLGWNLIQILQIYTTCAFSVVMQKMSTFPFVGTDYARWATLAFPVFAIFFACNGARLISKISGQDSAPYLSKYLLGNPKVEQGRWELEMWELEKFAFTKPEKEKGRSRWRSKVMVAMDELV